MADRIDVWVAVGILMEHTTLSNDDALAALRAYALATDDSLDELAAHLLSRQLRPEQVLRLRPVSSELA